MNLQIDKFENKSIVSTKVDPKLLENVDIMETPKEAILNILKNVSNVNKSLTEMWLEKSSDKYIALTLYNNTINSNEEKLNTILKENTNLDQEDLKNIESAKEEISKFRTNTMESILENLTQIESTLKWYYYDTTAVKLYEKTIENYQTGYTTTKEKIQNPNPKQIGLDLQIQTNLYKLKNNWAEPSSPITITENLWQTSEWSDLVRKYSFDGTLKQENYIKVVWKEIIVLPMWWEFGRDFFLDQKWNIVWAEIIQKNPNYGYVVKWNETYIVNSADKTIDFKFQTPTKKVSWETKVDDTNINNFIKVLDELSYKLDKNIESANKVSQPPKPVTINMNDLSTEQINILAERVNSVQSENSNIPFTVKSIETNWALPTFNESINLVNTKIAIQKPINKIVKIENKNIDDKVITYIWTKWWNQVWIDKFLKESKNQTLNQISTRLNDNLAKFDEQMFLPNWESIFDIENFENIVVKYSTWEYKSNTKVSRNDKKSVLTIWNDSINFTNFSQLLKEKSITKKSWEATLPYTNKDCLDNLADVFGFEKIQIEEVIKDSNIIKNFELQAWEQALEIVKKEKTGKKWGEVDEYRTTDTVDNFFGVVRNDKIHIIRKITINDEEQYEDLNIELENENYEGNEIYNFTKSLEKIDKARQTTTWDSWRNTLTTLDLSEWYSQEQVKELVLDYAKAKWVVIQTLKLPNSPLPDWIENYISAENLKKSQEQWLSIQLHLPKISSEEKYNELKEIPNFPPEVNLVGKTKIWNENRYVFLDYGSKSVDWSPEFYINMWSKKSIDIWEIIKKYPNRNEVIAKLIKWINQKMPEMENLFDVKSKIEKKWEAVITKDVLSFSMFDMPWFGLEFAKLIMWEYDDKKPNIKVKEDDGYIEIWKTKIQIKEGWLGGYEINMLIPNIKKLFWVE